MQMSTKPYKALLQSLRVSSAFPFRFHHGVRLRVERTVRAFAAPFALYEPAFEQNAFDLERREFFLDDFEPRAHSLAHVAAEFFLRTFGARLELFDVAEREGHLLRQSHAPELRQRRLVLFTPAALGLQRPVDEAFALVEAHRLHADTDRLGGIADPFGHHALHDGNSAVRTMLRMQEGVLQKPDA